MDYLYITLNKNASQYAISLDEIFLTLYGFSKKKKIAVPGKLMKKKSYDPSKTPAGREIPGLVYRIEVTSDQHDAVRDILCDFLMESHKYRYRLRGGEGNFSSAEFVAYILEKAGIMNFDDSVNGIAEEDLATLACFDGVDVVYEGDLKKYVAEHSNVRHLHTVKKDKKVVEHGTAQYEYVPDKMKELMTAD